MTELVSKNDTACSTGLVLGTSCLSACYVSCYEVLVAVKLNARVCNVSRNRKLSVVAYKSSTCCELVERKFLVSKVERLIFTIEDKYVRNIGLSILKEDRSVCVKLTISNGVKLIAVVRIPNTGVSIGNGYIGQSNTVTVVNLEAVHTTIKSNVLYTYA